MGILLWTTKTEGGDDNGHENATLALERCARMTLANALGRGDDPARERDVRPQHTITEFEIVRIVTVRVWKYTKADPGFVSGPPEKCREPWPAELEADAVCADGTVIELTLDEQADVLLTLVDRFDEVSLQPR